MAFFYFVSFIKKLSVVQTAQSGMGGFQSLSRTRPRHLYMYQYCSVALNFPSALVL